MKSSQTIDIALVGFESEDTENLTLRTMAAGLQDLGLRVHLILDSGSNQIEAMATRIRKCNPRILGCSLPDSTAALHLLPLIKLARRRGFSGYAVCGGAFATLNWEWVLSHAAEVDGVIRNHGIQPLKALHRALENDDSLSGVSGLATRNGINPFSVEAEHRQWIPLRGPRPTVMGAPTADMLLGTGCSDKCEYCTHAATATLWARECKDAGASPWALREAGMAAASSRPLPHLVEEMSVLYHEDNVRYFQLISDNPLPAGETAALRWIDTMKGLLLEHRMCDVALGFMVRGDRLTIPVVDALVDLGLTRSFVGVESGSKRGLARIGRVGDPLHIHSVLSRLSQKGVITYFNSLLLNPRSTLSSIAEELAFLESIRGTIFESVQVKPFVGTALHQQLQRNHQLTGAHLSPGFSTAEPGVAAFQRLLVRFNTRVLGPYTPSAQILDLRHSAVLWHRFGNGGSAARAADARLRELGEQTNHARIMALRCLVEMARRGDTDSPFPTGIVDPIVQLQREIEAISVSLSKNNAAGMHVCRIYRNLAAAASLTFVLAASPGCYDTHDTDTDSETDTIAITDTGIDTETVSATTADTTSMSGTAKDTTAPETDTIASDTDTTAPDADTEGPADTQTPLDTDTDSLIGDTAIDTDTACDYENHSMQIQALRDLMGEHCTALLDGMSHNIYVTLNENGEVLSVHLDGVPNPESHEELVACYMDLLKGERFPCIAGETVWMEPQILGIIE